ncbi:MAG: hypothetical protein IMZ50_17350 [Candidatus Atribacteria bacterium]|nr:hypothetical protein [Candidatus Atribacteria bacterium]
MLAALAPMAMSMLSGGSCTGASPLSGGMLSGGGETDPSVSQSVESKLDVSAQLTGGAMTTNFGGEATNWIMILGVVAAIFFLGRKKS